MSHSLDFPRPAQPGDEQILFTICTEALEAAHPLLAAYAQLELLTPTIVAKIRATLPLGSGPTVTIHGIFQHSSFDTLDRLLESETDSTQTIFEQWEPTVAGWERTCTVTTGPQQSIALETHFTSAEPKFYSLSVNASPGSFSIHDLDQQIILSRQTENSWDEIAFPAETILPILFALFPALSEI